MKLSTLLLVITLFVLVLASNYYKDQYRDDEFDKVQDMIVVQQVAFNNLNIRFAEYKMRFGPRQWDLR